MENNKTLLASMSIVMIVVISVSVYLSSGTMAQDGHYDEFAQCLTERGAVMYGAEWCRYCKRQKEMFGSSFEFINYVECPEDQQICDQEGVKGYPTWIINGEVYRGLQDFSTLATATGCET